MKCSDVEELFSAYANEELSRTQREFVEEHLANCADCRVKLTDYGLVRQQLLSLRTVPSMSDIKRTTMSKIKGEQMMKPIQRWLRPVLVAVPIVAIMIAIGIVQPWVPSLSTQNVMAKAYSAIESVRSYRCSATYVEGTSETTVEFEFKSPDSYHLKQTTMEISSNYEFIIIGENQFVKTGDPSRTAPTALTNLYTNMVTREATLGWLNKLKDIQQLPYETIDSTFCYHYLGDYDFEKMLRLEQEEAAKIGVPPRSDEEIAKLLEQIGSISWPIEVWIGKDDYLIRKMIINVTQSSNNSGQMISSVLTYDFFDFNQPITIEAPLDTNGQLLPDWRLVDSS